MALPVGGVFSVRWRVLIEDNSDCGYTESKEHTKITHLVIGSTESNFILSRESVFCFGISGSGQFRIDGFAENELLSSYFPPGLMVEHL